MEVNETKAAYEANRADDKKYLLQCQSNDIPADVLDALGRQYGYTLDALKAMGAGYDPDGVPAQLYDGKQDARRVVFPWPGSDWAYCAVSVADRVDVKGGYAIKPTHERTHEALTALDFNTEPGRHFFLVSDPLMALRIKSLGYPALCVLHSNRYLTDDINGKLGAAVALADPDDQGTLPEGINVASSDFLRKAVKGDKYGLGGAIDEAKEAFRDRRTVNPLDVALGLLDAASVPERIPTGFRSLDAALDGGLPPFLTAMGATSSTGKTTFSLQMADDMAARGVPVLFVTIEQTAQELVAKSLSRDLYITRNVRGNGFMPTATDIQSRQRRSEWGRLQNADISEAARDYSRRIAGNLTFMEGRPRPTAADIRGAVDALAFDKSRPPVVIIDYTQLIAPPKDYERASDKQITDFNINALCNLANEFNTPVFAISSLNRSSYTGCISMESFKESGAIEYSSNILLGLQPYGMAQKSRDLKPSEFEKDQKRTNAAYRDATLKSCELLILKNRGGRPDYDGLPFTFNAPHSYYTEGTAYTAQGALTV